MQGEFLPFQQGFISGQSCLSSLLETVELKLHYLDSDSDSDSEVNLIYLDFYKAFDLVHYSAIPFVDLKKTFNTVINHDISSNKMYCYGFTNKRIRLFHFNNLSQRIK